MTESSEELKTRLDRQKKHIKELEKVIERYKRENEFCKKQLSDNLDKYYKLRVAQEEALSLMNDIEELKNELKAVRNGEIR